MQRETLRKGLPAPGPQKSQTHASAPNPRSALPNSGRTHKLCASFPSPHRPCLLPGAGQLLSSPPLLPGTPASVGLCLPSELRRGSPRGRCPTACPCGLFPEPRHLLPPLRPIANTSLCFSDPRHPVSRRPAPGSLHHWTRESPRDSETSGAWAPHPLQGRSGHHLQPPTGKAGWSLALVSGPRGREWQS